MAEPSLGTAGLRIAGSFRDPSGYVFLRDGRVFRAVDQGCLDTLRMLESDGSLERLIADGLLVGTRLVQDPALLPQLRSDQGDHAAFLEHQRVDPISYPYEWSPSMLADAGILTLDLQLRLLAVGTSLKDASAYNVQFVRGKPVFIDASSIERPERRDVWFALGQFQRMFVYPLLLCRHRGWDLRSYFLPNLDGRNTEQVARAFGLVGRWRPRLWLDLTLPLILGRRAERRRTPPEAARANGRPPAGPEAQIVNLRRLRRKLAALARGYRPAGVWAEYTTGCSYDDAAEDVKKSIVRAFLQETRPRRVVDLGCNTGDYSYLAAECGAEVIAADQDPDAVELLYRRLKARPAPITPVVQDLANPSPAIGYLNEERLRFLERAPGDCVLALALMHHLLVNGNLSLAAIRDLLAGLTRDGLVLEFVPAEDEMFRKLVRFRRNLFEGITLEACRAAFRERFTVVREESIPGLRRTLLLLRLRDRN